MDWDDLDAKPEDLKWLEVTVRILVHKEEVGLTERMIAKAETVETMTVMPLGTPAKCTCGTVAINTDKHPWGEGRYGKGTYCPECQGDYV